MHGVAAIALSAEGTLMAVSDSDLIVADADPGTVRRHRLLFRAVQRRKNPPLRRTDITVTDEAAVKRGGESGRSR